MKNIINRFFGGGSQSVSELSAEVDKREIAQSFTLERAPEDAKAHAESLRRAFVLAIQNSPYIKPSGHEEILAYLMHETKDLLKGGTPLSADEKKSLGYSSRSKITRESLAVLTQQAVEAGLTPTDVIHALYTSVARKHQHLSNMSRMHGSGIKRYSVIVVATGQECTWCKSMNGAELDIAQDFQVMSEENCTNSPPCIFAINPILDWGD